MSSASLWLGPSGWRIVPPRATSAGKLAPLYALQMVGEAKCRTLTEAYRRLGIEVTNPRRMWSAQSEDGRVVLTLWSNLFGDADRRVYDVTERPLGDWWERPENRRRIEHLKHARATADGVFNSIIVTQSGRTYTRIASVEIGPRFRLVKLDKHGRFRAEKIDK